MLSEPSVPPEQNPFVLCSAMVQTDKVSLPNNVPFFTLSFFFCSPCFSFYSYSKKEILKSEGRELLCCADLLCV